MEAGHLTVLWLLVGIYKLGITLNWNTCSFLDLVSENSIHYYVICKNSRLLYHFPFTFIFQTLNCHYRDLDKGL